MSYELIHGNSLEKLKDLPDQSIDSVVCDPPYASVQRDYGWFTEEEWHKLMDGIVPEVRRVLKPKGSAIFILQPNHKKMGQMSTWMWEFYIKWAKEWNSPQDLYWWNYAYMPTTHVSAKHALMRPSVKMCCWFGDADCYRNQHAILWEPAKASKAHDLSDRALKKYPSGSSMREGRCTETMLKRGGSTPFNCLPVVETTDNLVLCTGGKRAGSLHGATTPLPLCETLVKYITPAGGTVLDPFSGVATVGVAAIKHGFNYVGIEQMKEYYEEAKEVLADAEKTYQKSIL